jgi:hypothetical protein
VSFDIVILQPKHASEPLASLEEVVEAFPLGTPEEIRRQLDLVVPGIEWSSETSGIYQADEGYALEISIPDETRPSSLHVALHFGSQWEAAGSSAFDRLVRTLHSAHGWQSFAVSDNSSLLLDSAEE